ANHGRATPCRRYGCGMLPDLRFAIGAVLASALLIVAAFGLAATVRVAHRQAATPAATPDDPWRTLAFTDPTDWGLLADRSQPTPAKAPAKTEAPEVSPADLAVTSAGPSTTGAITPRAPVVAAPPAEPAAVPAASKPDPVEVEAAIPQPAAEP